MRTLLFIIQFTGSIAIILAVLLHPAKTFGMGGIGSPSELFGSQKGAEEGLNKITIVIAAIWGLVSILLSTPSIMAQ